MVSMGDFVGLDRGLRTLLGVRDKAFGGLRVVLIGDVYQLKPPDGDGYFFETATFDDLKDGGLVVLSLLTQHRQVGGTGGDEDDWMLRRLLVDARAGRFGTLGANLLAYVGARPTAPWSAVRIVARRADAARHNAVGLARLTGPQYECGNGTVLRVGARVVFTQNYYSPGADGALLAPNGAVGDVVGLPSPRTSPAIVLVAVDGGGVLGVTPRSLRGKLSHPLGLAWALTIHKTQGQTFPGGVVVDGTCIGEAGQAYVAISRVRRLECLWVTNLLATDFEIPREESWLRFVAEYGLQ